MLMKVTIIAIGKCKKNSPEAAIIAEYVKRSGWDIVIKEKDNAAQEDEAEFLQSSIPHGAKVIVLDERGENLKSVELARKIETADGHLQSTRNLADLILSFGRLTLPHMLMRAVLSEQIYRIQTIINHHPYHRE